MNSKVIINISIAVLVILLIYFAYSLFSGTPATEEPVGVTAEGFLTDTATTTGGAATQQFITILASLNGVTLSGDIFEDEVFNNKLQDFSRPLPTRPFGRINPFAPVGAAGSFSKSTSTASLSAGNQ